MSNRGRPKTPGVLTPREQEVLALIRVGLSNREIAERLDISLAGAKFHVSEIIGKLGVSSREEAAIWQPDPRRHFGGLVVLPLVAIRRLRLLLPTSKLALASLVLPVVTALVVASAVGIDEATTGHQPSATSSRQSKAPEATETPSPVFPNCVPPVCIVQIPERYATPKEAADRAGFDFRMPAYIPPGFTLVGSMYLPPVPDIGESVVLFYEDGAHQALTVSEGAPGFIRPAVSPETPVSAHGEVVINGRTAMWVMGFMSSGQMLSFGSPSWTDNDSFRLGWYIDGTNPPIEPRPDRLSYSLSASSLPLAELIRIAESVPLP